MKQVVPLGPSSRRTAESGRSSVVVVVIVVMTMVALVFALVFALMAALVPGAEFGLRDEATRAHAQAEDRQQGQKEEMS